MGDYRRDWELWHTPLIGAFLLWKFALGYQAKSHDGEAPNPTLLFVAAAILTSPALSKPINSNRLGLSSYAFSFKDEHNDIVLEGLTQRIKDRAEYTMRAIDAALTANLFSTVDGCFVAIPREPVSGAAKLCRKTIGALGSKAETLGGWFAERRPSEISLYLGVEF